jgi:hypothetical protein
METLDDMIWIPARKPDTGGSGGGPSKDLWPKPEPLSILGMNSNVVYGTNVAIACPLNFQLAYGGNLQICISPNAGFLYDPGSSGTIPPLPGAFSQWLGSGLGGNMQFTMGTSANFVVGQVFDINLGPRRITLDVHTVSGVQPLLKVMSPLIIISTIIYLFAYGAIPQDDARIILTMVFQVAFQFMMVAIMDIQGIYHQMDDFYKNTLDTIFSTNPAAASAPQTVTKAPSGEISITAAGQPDANAFGNAFSGNSTIGAGNLFVGILLVMVLPVILEIVGEVKLAKPDPPQTVVDSAGHTIGTVSDN